MIHNVSDPNLIKIQDQCYTVEQLVRKGNVTDATNMLASIILTAKMLQEELEKDE